MFWIFSLLWGIAGALALYIHDYAYAAYCAAFVFWLLGMEILNGLRNIAHEIRMAHPRVEFGPPRSDK